MNLAHLSNLRVNNDSFLLWGCSHGHVVVVVVAVVVVMWFAFLCCGCQLNMSLRFP